MSQYIIDALGWLLMIGAFLSILLMVCTCVVMAAPLWMAVLFDREQRHGRMLELMDKQIELERAMRGDAGSEMPAIEVPANASLASEGRLPARCEVEVPDAPAPPA